MQRLIFIFSLFILAIVGCSSNESHSFLIRPDGGGEDAATEIEVGKTIPAWQEGVMDIHFINTTTGESMFVIFPDGTQMLSMMGKWTVRIMRRRFAILYSGSESIFMMPTFLSI